ncbi:dynein regulatory complex subunit 7 [Etheostoma spectabile]|uniref:dynein regulatory complex subunit 7 n=1 Tax=Etheostoma spectabile TaxID=54343 RepID=UPI0013AF858C|nr:dynein regulatory complex subunit 7-like [Etheostoma spectabile]
METLLESDGEEQVRDGEQEEVDNDDRELNETLSNLHVSAPQDLLLKLDKADNLYPESYRVNSPDEIRLLAIGDNHHRQYSHLFPSRKPLLLCPVNECGVKKFVSMTLRPSPTVHPELYTWEGCASFVADFLSLDPLDPPVDLPRYLFLPHLGAEGSESHMYLETRWPGGQKVTHYRKAQLEKFAPYLRPDGLNTRLTTYKDLDSVPLRGSMKKFSPGRSDPDSTSTQRAPEVMRSWGSKLLLTSPVSEEELKGTGGRKVVECFHRNRSKPANEDVAQRVFLLAQRRIELTYHLEDHRFIPSKRSFIKPQESTEKKKGEDFTSDMESSFQVDPSEKPLKTLALNDMLVALMKDEEKVVCQIKESKQEVRDIVACREQEERDVQLEFSPWTTTGAAMARGQRQEMEHLAAEEQRWLQEKEKDILAPFLIRLDNAETLSAEDAKHIHQDCLAEFKQRLAEHANLIQERYEKQTQELQSKQEWYQKNQLNMTKPQEEEYLTYCHEKTLQICVAKKRLSMHKEAAPQKYWTLDQKLRSDPRLAPHLLTF